MTRPRWRSRGVPRPFLYGLLGLVSMAASIPTVTAQPDRSANRGPATGLRYDTGGDHFILTRQ